MGRLTSKLFQKPEVIITNSIYRTRGRTWGLQLRYTTHFVTNATIPYSQQNYVDLAKYGFKLDLVLRAAKQQTNKQTII